jgi:hypothetical protein
MGMVRRLSANGEYKKALGFAENALPQAQVNNNKSKVENIIGLLEEGKDINHEEEITKNKRLKKTKPVFQV